MGIFAAFRSTSLAPWAAVGALAAATTALTPAAHAQPTFSKVFQPSTIGPGSAAVLRFDITNGAPSPVTDLAFTDVLPAGVVITAPSVASTTCVGGVLTAPAGGGTITFTDGALGAFAACQVEVYTTASIPGTHMNVSGDLTSSAGNSGSAAANLTVANNRPGFSKSLAPSSVTLGGRSTLTFTIDNTQNGGPASSLNFTDQLPPGLSIASPSNATTSCTAATLTVTPGTGTISQLGGSVLAGATCTVEVDVIGVAPGLHINVSSPLTNSGLAVASLDVISGTVSATKDFTDDPVPPGGVATLSFTLRNVDRINDATAIAFTDDLDATLSGLVAVGLPQSNVCGPGSLLSGTSLVSLTGGFLAADGGECTFSIPVQVPAGAVPGAYPNTTSAVTATLGGTPFVGPPATETLFVSNAPTLTKSFLTDPVGGGDTVSIEFTLTNNSSTSAATGISFTDNLEPFLSGVAVVALPPAGFCGAGSAAAVGPGPSLTILGANLPPSGSCTFTVDLALPVGTPAGTYTNTTSIVTATVDGSTQTGQPASDTLGIVAAPLLTKQFTDDPVLPGGTVTLEFTLEHDEAAPAPATAISFGDDLAATLTGLTAVGLPANDICGVGSSLSGTTNLTFTGGTLAPGASCTFSVTLQVPAGAVPGNYPNVTSNVTASVSGVATTRNGAGDVLAIAGLSLTKLFTNDPALPGGTLTLEFTLTNSSPISDATAISFADPLGFLPGLAAVGLPANDVCGLGSSISGTTTLVFTGGNLLANTSCTFPVTLQIPAGASAGDYGNVTSVLSATIDGNPAVLPPANDTLTIESAILDFAKSFTNDPVSPGGTVDLEFTISNISATNPISAITFTDDLDAALSGLVAVGLPANDVCGAGSQISGTSLLTLTGGTLAAGGSCTFTVTLQVPAGVSPGTTAVNTTSQISGTVGAVPVTGGPATDTLLIRFLLFSKSFDGPSSPGGSPILTFTIQNLSPTQAAGGLGFVDDLGAGLPGLVAVGLPTADVCGAGSSLSGAGVVTLSGGSIAPASSCSFPVTLLVPAGAAPGTYPNTTSALFESGLEVAPAATADLQIEPPPTFAKAFAPTVIGLASTSTLTFTIENTGSAVAASALAFTDNLPAGLIVATPANTASTCAGTTTATPGTAVVSLSGGSVAAGAACTVAVDIAATAVGSLLNTTGDLTSSSGNSGPASATLTVEGPPTFQKAFAPMVVGTGGVSTMTLTIDNTANTIAATGLAVTDTLPAGMVVATPPNASTTCSGGTITAVAGSGTVSFVGASVAAGASCSLQVDVQGNTPGALLNTTGDLTSSHGNSGQASATLTVEAPPSFTKAFAPDVVAVGGVSTMTLTIDNSANSLAVSNLAVTDNLPAGMVVAATPNASTTCGGVVTAVAGTTAVSFAGGTVAGSAICTVSADVEGTTPGSLVNTTGDLTSSSGSSGAASDTLNVVGAVLFTKSFLSAPVLRGGLVELEYTIENPTVASLSAMAFSDDLGAVIAGMAATGLPANDVCGLGSVLSGTTTVSFAGGSLAPGGSCTFSVLVQVPAAAPVGVFTSTSDLMTFTPSVPLQELGPAFVAGPAIADLEVAYFTFTKTFIPAAAGAGDTVVLELTITNPDPVNATTNITFSDDLDAVIPGMAAVGLPLADACGAGSTVSGTNVVTLAGGSLAAAGSCTFAVSVVVPATALTGTYTNVTSGLDATVAGNAVSGGPASTAGADLDVEASALVIPTLETWGLLALALLLLAAAGGRLRQEARQP